MTRAVAAPALSGCDSGSVSGRVSGHADAALANPYTAAIRAAAALFAEGAIPKDWPKGAALPATPLEPAGGLEMEEIETGAFVFAA